MFTVIPRRAHVEYYLDHRENYFFVVINEGKAHNFKLVRVPIQDSYDRTKWQVKWR